MIFYAYMLLDLDYSFFNLKDFFLQFLFSILEI